MDPQCDYINVESPLKEAVDLFTCGLCKFIVQPFPLECPQCNGLYCESCVQTQQQWACQGPMKGINCSSRLQPVKLHRDVRDVLEVLQFACPGCKEKLKYEPFFEHIKTCAKIPKEKFTTKAQIDEAIGKNSSKVASFKSSGKPLSESIYIFDKDSKNVFVFDWQNARFNKFRVTYMPSDGYSQVSSQRNSANNFPHNFQLVQVGQQPMLFMIGGGDFNLTPASMYEAYQLVYNRNASTYDCMLKARMQYPRHGHSACAISDTHILVTGSRKDVHRSSQKCELYNIQSNKWQEISMLNNGRHYHASCDFNGEMVYVFCGISNQTKRYSNSIERLEISLCLRNMTRQWTEIQLRDPKGNPFMMTARQGLGAAQYTSDTIMIVGGFGGKYFDESLKFNPNNNTVQHTKNKLQQHVFPFAVPTVGNIDQKELYTIDWSTFSIFKYDAKEKWSQMAELKQR